MSHHLAHIYVSPRLAVASLPAGLVLGPRLPSVSPDRAGGRWGLYPGRQLQLSPQWLSLPQAPLPEAWLEVRWHGCSALAACKWIAAPPGPALTPSPAPQAPGTGTHPYPCSSLTALIVVPGWEGLGLLSGTVVGWQALMPTCFLPSPPRHAAGCAGDLPPDTPREAVHDVQRHPEQGDPACLQKVHARRE